MYTVAEVAWHEKDELGLQMKSRYAGRETIKAEVAEGGLA